MDVSGTNPYKYLVVTRVMATTLMIPFLVILADAVSLYGAYLGANIHGVVSWNLFWNQVFDTIVYSDITPSILKTYFFGFFIGIIGCYKGFNSKKGTEGVGQSANSAVVISSLLVFIIDLLAVQITDVLNIN
jgi:phospholipid/cholesterol/gamma-HCH transport system permease protein